MEQKAQEYINKLYIDYGGIEEEWTTHEAIDNFIAQAQNSFGFTEVPELIV